MEKVENTSQAPHQRSSEEVLKSFNSSKEGISQKEAERRLEKYGKNMIERGEGISPFKMFLEQFNDPLVLLLIVAMVISAFIALEEGEPLYDSTMIGLIVIANGVIGFVQEYRAEQSLEALMEMLEPTAVVIRDGHKNEIPAEEVVPGDIIVLQPGARVAADARLIRASNLETQEAPLTGESTPVPKNVELQLPADAPVGERQNMVFMGTTVTKGAGEAVVTTTGMNTEFGDIAHEVQRVEREETPLMRRIGKFGKNLAIIILVVTIGAVVTEYIQTLDPVKSFMVAVGLAISAVPEGLPAVVTITLALGMGTLAEHNAIVRKLSSVEALGSTTVICSDKTGTITKNEMTVREAYVSGDTFEVTGTGYNPEGEIQYVTETNQSDNNDSLQTTTQMLETPKSSLSRMLRAFSLCNNAEIIYDETDERYGLVGDPTEGALLTLSRKGGIVREEQLEKYPEIHENPFSSARKMMSTVHKTPEGKKVSFVKGAPEELLEYSTHFYEDGEVKELTPEKEEEILDKVNSMTEKALRVLSAAYKPVEGEDYGIEEVERNLIFVGLAGMIDPPREGVAESIRLCRKAGMEVKMVTGDHLATARAVAKEIDLLKSNEDEQAMTGRKVGRLSDQELREAVKTVKVFARVSPKHKVRIAEALKANGEIVAMTGDGVNDAPAVKRADIGVSMGIKGTEVTREASDMALADDDFSTIVNAVREGRGIYGNIRKFLRYLLSSNFDEIFLIGVAAFLAFPILPLKPLQILWLNLATDGLPATALAFDTYEEGLMERKPRDPDEGLLHGMELFVTVYAIAQFLASFGLFYVGIRVWHLPPKQVNTMVFMEALFFELSSVWNCRSETHSVWARGMENFENKFFVLGVLVNIPLTLAMVYWAPFRVIFDTAILTFRELMITFGISIIGLFLLPEVLMRSERTPE